MHDRNGTPLNKGDRVLIEGVISELYSGVDYCNVKVDIGMEQEHGPANVQTSISSINTRQLLLLKKSE